MSVVWGKWLLRGIREGNAIKKFPAFATATLCLPKTHHLMTPNIQLPNSTSIMQPHTTSARYKHHRQLGILPSYVPYSFQLPKFCSCHYTSQNAPSFFPTPDTQTLVPQVTSCLLTAVTKLPGPFSSHPSPSFSSANRHVCKPYHLK